MRAGKVIPASRFLPELLVLAVGVGLYAFQLGQESLWIDEMLSLGSARGYLDLNRPLYFLLLRVWLLAGEGEAWLRSLSVLFGLGALALTYCLGRRLVSRQVGLVAAVLFVLSPLAINHAQEVRFYMMSACLGVAGSLCLSYALQNPKAVSLFGWIVCRCLGFLTAQPNLLLIVPDFFLIAWLLLRKPAIDASFDSDRGEFRKNDFRLGRWRWALGLLLIPTVLILKDMVPPLIEFLFNQKWYAGAARPPTLSNLVGLLAALTAWPLAGPDALSGFYQPLLKLYAGLVLVGSLLPMVYRKGRWQSLFSSGSPQLFWIALWGFLPLVLVFLLSQVFPFLWLERYAVISIPYVTILLATAWVLLWNRQRWMAIALALFYIVAVSGPLLRYYTTDYHADWRGLSEEISLYEQMGDRVVVYPGSFMPYIDRYYDGNAKFVPIESVDSAEDVDPEKLAVEIQKMGLPNRRFWLVCPTKDRWNGAQEDVLAALTSKGFLLKKESPKLNHWNWGPVLYLFELRLLNNPESPIR